MGLSLPCIAATLEIYRHCHAIHDPGPCGVWWWAFCAFHKDCPLSSVQFLSLSMSEWRSFWNQNEIYTNSNIPKLGLAFPLNSTRETTFSEVIVWARGEAPLHPWIIPPPPVRHVRGHGGACKVPIFAASQSQCKCKCHRAFHDQINTCMLCLSGIQSTLVNGKSFDSTEEIQNFKNPFSDPTFGKTPHCDGASVRTGS